MKAVIDLEIRLLRVYVYTRYLNKNRFIEFSNEKDWVKLLTAKSNLLFCIILT